MMKNLSFPDFDVENMEFLPEQKILRIYVEGAWLEDKEGRKLDRGFLFFNDWESLSINRYDSNMEKWIEVEYSNIEQLKDLCEVKFSDSSVSLSGFGRDLGQWLEWKIINTKMHAEFES